MKISKKIFVIMFIFIAFFILADSKVYAGIRTPSQLESTFNTLKNTDRI